MDGLSSRAVAAAVDVAKRHGLACSGPDVLKDGANVLVHLRPAAVVARVATTTALVRRPARDWLARDLAMARYLAGQGVPVVPPSGELPPGPHEQDGFAITFWQYVEHDRSYVPSRDEAGAMLRELHRALRDSGRPVGAVPGDADALQDLPWMGPLTEIPRWIDWLEQGGVLGAEDCSLLRRSQAEIEQRVRAAGGGQQALHGDAHKGNLLKTPHGLVWTDFEDSCFGPVAWDLACFARTAAGNMEDALRSYGGNWSLEDLEPFLEARELEAVAWYQVLVTRFADRRQRAAELLSDWRERWV